MTLRNLKTNKIGLTDFAIWDNGIFSGAPLREQLDKEGVKYHEVNLNKVVSGASLIYYISKKSGVPITILCIQLRDEDDRPAEEYYYFEGMTLEQAIRDEDWWKTAHQTARLLVDKNLTEI